MHLGAARDGWRGARSVGSAVSADGAKISFEVIGRGPPVLCLHGLPGSRENWHDLGYVDGLSPRNTLVLLDARGHGESERATRVENYRFPRVADDIEAVADAVGHRSFAVMGFSWGADAALRYASARDRATAVVAIGGVFGAAMTPERCTAAIAWWSRVIGAKREGRLFSMSLKEDELLDLDEPYDPNTIFAAIGGFVSWPWVEPEQITVPALVLAGGMDARVMSAFRSYRHRLTACSIAAHVVNGVGHRDTMRRSDLAVPVIRDFLVQNVSRPRAFSPPEPPAAEAARSLIRAR